MVLSPLGRSHAKGLFVGMGEMGQVSEPDIEVDIGRFPAFFVEQVMRFFQAFMCQPAAGCGIKQLGKIAFEPRQTSPCEVGKPVDADIVAVMLVHERFEVYFAGRTEIEEHILQCRVGIQQEQHEFGYLELFDVFVHVAQGVDIGLQRIDELVEIPVGLQQQHIGSRVGCTGWQVVLAADLLQSILVYVNGNRLETTIGRPFDVLGELVAAKEPVVARLERVKFIADPDIMRAGYDETENMVGHKRFAFNVAIVITVVQDAAVGRALGLAGFFHNAVVKDKILFSR